MPPELEWIRRGVYGHKRQGAPRLYDRLLTLDHVEFQDRTVVERALGNVRRGLDFADSLRHASSIACEAFPILDARRFANEARRLAITPPVRQPG